MQNRKTLKSNPNPQKFEECLKAAGIKEALRTNWYSSGSCFFLLDIFFFFVFLGLWPTAARRISAKPMDMSSGKRTGTGTGSGSASGSGPGGLQYPGGPAKWSPATWPT